MQNHFRGNAVNISLHSSVYVRVRANARARVQACSLTYPACQAHAPHYIVICGLSGSTTLFDIISKNGMIFGKEGIEHKMCVSFSLQILYEIFLILIRIQLDIIINVKVSSCKVPVSLVTLKRNLNFQGRFSKTDQI